MMAGAAPEALYRGRFSLERIALFDPLGDAGIGGYTHELATALHRAGSFVHVSTWVSLVVIVAILGGAVGLSLLMPRKDATEEAGAKPAASSQAATTTPR